MRPCSSKEADSHVGSRMSVLLFRDQLGYMRKKQEYAPLGLAGQVEHAWAGGVDIADGSLLVQGVELELLLGGWLDRAVLREVLDGRDGLLELSCGHDLGGKVGEMGQEMEVGSGDGAEAAAGRDVAGWRGRII